MAGCYRLLPTRKQLQSPKFLCCLALFIVASTGLLSILPDFHGGDVIRPEFPRSQLQVTPLSAKQSGANGNNEAGLGGVAKKSGGKIPFILHQTWITDIIPSTYVPYATSWTTHRPPLAYYYWTDATALSFVARHYPQMLDTFRGYKAHLCRADAIRYMLLHHYGGVYADMDMQRLRDLTPLLTDGRELCYLSQERYEITRLYWGRNSSVMNALMLSAPGHRFMDHVIRALPRFARLTDDVMHSTGPFFLQQVFDDYHRSPPCDLRDPMCRCAAADPYAFMPQIDPIRIPLFRGKCASPRSLKPNQLAACDMLQRRGWRNDLRDVSDGAYTHHGFLHYGFENQRLRFQSVANISSVRPDRHTFGRDFH